ncbi:hypothetical protein IscW_ISCW003041 [Ixodes scapularis]|uniref:Nose resistant-to-fluoxetine protein N-terminal domain-containing protein n=1 Tax=Ixodes scapularis TaxID=6945 RepID=B7PDI4_IXOSC|nr:hypothetical protein IscW_ISCW003041 [Ixodes scapularis]|eukprot:XP_002410827.1 hypothetical protein IscW_ISCW003041 [Ixodes scapularis]
MNDAEIYAVFKWTSPAVRPINRVLDATGRPAAGTLEGTLSDFGNYDECLKIRLMDDYSGEETFRGKYCTLKFAAPMPPKPERLNYHQNLFNTTLDEGGVRKLLYMW